MKKLINLISLFCILGTLFISCTQPTSPSSPSKDNSNSNNNTVTFSEGWWLFSTESSNFYIYYNAEKNITRAGSESQEYSDTILNNMKSSEIYKWDNCVKYAKEDERITFKKITESELPQWNKDPILGTWKFDVPLNVLRNEPLGIYKNYLYCVIGENYFRIYTGYPTEELNHDDNYYIHVNYTKENNSLVCKPVQVAVNHNVDFNTTYNIIGNKIYFSKMFTNTDVVATKIE